MRSGIPAPTDAPSVGERANLASIGMDELSMPWRRRLLEVERIDTWSMLMALDARSVLSLR